MDLKRRLYRMPAEFGLDHARIFELRTELRRMFFRELCGSYSSLLFDGDPQDQCLLSSSEWLKLGDEVTVHSHHGRPCGRKLERGEPTHRCLTCGLDDTCVLCKYCFNPRDHVGHNVFVKISSKEDGGICDCGDPEAWKREVHCFSDPGGVTTQPLPPEFLAQASHVLSIVMDFIVDVLFGMSLDFQTLRNERAIIARTQRAALVPERYGVGPEESRLLDKWCLQVWDDDKKSVTDMRASLLLSTHRKPEFINMITERIQRTGKATVMVSDSVKLLSEVRRRCTHFVTSIRSLEDIMREEMAAELVSCVSALASARFRNADVSEALKLVAEAFLEPWLPGVPPNELVDLSTPQLRSEVDQYTVPLEPKLLTFDYDKEDLSGSADASSLESEELFGPGKMYARLSQGMQQHLSQFLVHRKLNWPIESERLRLKLLIFFDVRLPKLVRHELTDLYVAVLLSNHPIKTRASIVYADVYPSSVDQLIHLDRDTELSVTMALSTQLFTTPSVATKLMQTDAFEVYMNLLRRFFSTTDIVDPRVFRNRRLAQVFHELGYLLWRNTVKQTVGGNPYRLVQSAQFLALFQGLAPMHRRADKHIEYENEKWVYCYASMPYALTLARSIAVGIEYAPRDMQRDALRGLQQIAESLKLWQNAMCDEFGAQTTSIKMSYGPIADLAVDLCGIDVSVEPVSLLNPVHAFASWIIQFATFDTLEELTAALGITDIRDYAMFDAPMATLAVVAHISVGYWVRNGYAMRIQLQSYRDATLCDLAYTRDIHMTQVALALLEPNTVFMNLVQHFRIMDWPTSTLGDLQQGFYLLDEFVHTLMALLTDRVRLQGLNDLETKIAVLGREILQTLGFKTMAYSELTRIIPESLVVDEHFDTVLQDLAEYTPPTANGVGRYTLKREYHDKFDPFYTNFTMSQCEEAEKEAVEQLGPNHTGPILPLSPVWRRLGLFTKTPGFAQFVLRVLVKLRSINTPQAEASLGRLLYLLVMAAKSDLLDAKAPAGAPTVQDERSHEREFATFAALMKAAPNLGALNQNESILSSLYTIHSSDTFLSTHGRIELLIELLHEQDPTIAPPPTNKAVLKAKQEYEKKTLKRRGRAVQERVLAEMQKQQQQFMQNSNLGVGIEDDDDSMDDGLDGENAQFPRHCVLCQMPDDRQSIFGLLTYTSQLRVLREVPDDPGWVHAAYCESPSLDVEHPPSHAVSDTFYGENGSVRNEVPYTIGNYVRASPNERKYPWGPAFPASSVRTSVVVQGCGHGAHQTCLQDFLRIRQQQRSVARPTPEHPREGEFLCPLCRGLNNCFMPVLWAKNDVDTNSFLAEGPDHLESVSEFVRSSLSDLNPKFMEAIEQHDFSDDFHMSVRNVLLEQMLAIKKRAICTDFDQNYGLRAVFRSFAESVQQIEVSLRGRPHSTPFGGLVVDQLPTRVTQFLRVFAKYLSTLAGFILSSVRDTQPYEAQLVLAPQDTLTQAVELLTMGSIATGARPITVLRAVAAVEIGRAILTASKFSADAQAAVLRDAPLPEACQEEAAKFAVFQSFGNPLLLYKVVKYHLTAIFRQYALVVFGICGKYDADDFVGMMDLPEHDRLAEYLHLPRLSELLHRVGDAATLEGSFFFRFFGANTPPPPPEFSKLIYPSVYRLIPLPVRLDMIFNISGRRVDPAVCLTCGKMLTINANTESTMIGPCNAHIRECGLSQGIFLLGRLNFVLLLLPQDRGTFIPAPYLDMHGEPDENMRRGRPHFLQPIRYDMLMRDVWLSNGLPSLVVRKLDLSQDPGGWETL